MMENLKSEPFDEREEGEISLDDVSSSEETNYANSNKNAKKSGIGKKYVKRENGILAQDADHGKENRRFSNELIGTGSKPIAATLQEKNDDLLPISSDEDIEFVGLPGTSKQLAIHLGPKKKRKKKKKKKSGQRMLVIDDLVSTFDDEPDVLGVVADDRRDFIVSRPYANANDRSPSPIHRTNSPPRHTGWHLPRSPSKHYHSPLKHGRSPNRRSPSPRQRSPRKFLSPRKPPAFNFDRRVSHKPSRDLSPGRYNEAYASSLLKKVRHLETVGSITPVNQHKYKESSLKDKLSKMMIQSLPVAKENVNLHHSELCDRRNVGVKNDDEEDLEFLRRKALETKQLKNNVKSLEINGTVNAESNVSGNVNVSDDDEEDLELRMIALRSAVMKKHYDRVQRGIMKKKSGTNIKDESPFRDSLLDGLDNYSDDNPDETNDESRKIVSPIAQLSNVENARVEDMDLDSDIEREKEYSEPYSPTDELSDQTLIDPVFPGDESSIDQFPTPDVEQSSLSMTTPHFSDNFVYYFNEHMANVSSPYSPSDPTCTPQIDKSSRQEPATMLRDPRLRRHFNAVTEMSYSPKDTAVYNPTLPVCPPEIPLARTPLNINMNLRSSNLSNLVSVPLENTPSNLLSIIPVPFEQTSTLSLDSSATDQFNELKKINAKEINVIDKVQNDITYDDIVRDLAEYTGEPSYLQGVPDITKDVNKIPTLVNRTLVPVPILKTNKQLQQPLPNKKSDGSSEPSFKSAEMLPVNVQSQSTKLNTVFKPMKLPPVAKKSPLINTPAAAFNSTLNDESDAVLVNQRGAKVVANPDFANDNSSANPVSSQATESSRSVVEPANEPKTKVRRSRTPRNQVETSKKSPPRISVSGKSIIVANEKVNNRITIKRKSKTPEKKDSDRKNNRSAGETKKSDVDNVKNKDVKKSDQKKGKRPKSVTRFENKSDENSKNNSNSAKNSDSTTKQKKEITKKAPKPRTTKSLESNMKKTNIKKSVTIKNDDKKRRSSIDEDEEALRAALLASLPKRKKTSDSQSVATSSKSSTEGAHSAKRKSQDVKELSNQKQLSETTVMLPPTSVPSRSVSKQKIADSNKTTTDTASGGIVTKKRSSTATDLGPSKKIVKNSTVSSIDAEKILNAAEKIVDNEIQRKLALQQAAIDLLSGIKTPQNTKTNLSRSNTKDSTASIPPKIFSSRSLERLIIRLGEDSDSDSDDSDNERTKVKTTNVSVPSKETNKVPPIPTTDFERSVEEFLRSQREKQESSTTIPTTTTVKAFSAGSQKQTSPITNTPLAVRHLPASKQEEYRRLKQRIAEREQQKLKRPVQTTSKNQLQTLSTNECPSTASASTTSAVANDTMPIVEIHPQTKTVIPNADETQEIASDQPYTSISIQTQISQSAMELLQPTMKIDNIENNDLISTPLLPDIPIKADPSLLETSITANSNSKVDTIIPYNRLNEDASDTNSIGPMRPIDNLTIQFPNTRDNSYVRHITISRSDNVSDEKTLTPQVTSLGLRILTTDQLNMKFEDTHKDVNDDETHIEDRKFIFNESVQIIDDDVSTSCSIIENIDTNSIDTAITIETCKIESNRDGIEAAVSSHQVIVDSEASTVLLNSQKDCSDKNFNSDGLEATIGLDSTLILDSTALMDCIQTTEDAILNTSMNIPKSPLYDTQICTKPELSAQDQGQELSEKIETDIQTQLKAVCTLTEHQQRVQLTTWEKELVAKRYVVLHNLTQMAEDLRQWEIQTDLAAEVRRLRIQLQMAEERLQAQRAKTMDIRPQVTLTQTIINDGRGECMKLSKLCQEIGSKVMGAAYKIPKTGDQLLKERLRAVASMTKQLSKKKTPSIDLNEVPNSDVMATQLTLNNTCIENSGLNFQSTDHDLEINPHLTSVKIEKDDSKAILAEVSCNTSTETLMNGPMQDNAHVIHEVIEAMSNDTLSGSNDLRPGSQYIENADDVNISTIDNHLFKTEDGKPSIQPAISYESVLIASNTPRLNGLSSIMGERALTDWSSGETCYL